MKILIVAALQREVAPLARLRLQDIECLVTGEGRTNAERGLRRWLEKNHAEVILGVGFAGALSANLRIGDVVMDASTRLGASLYEKIKARNVQANATSNAAPEFAALHSKASTDHVSSVCLGRIITVDDILNAEGKAELARTLAANETACVEMEAAALADVCREKQLPFVSVRVISDLLEEDFPVDFNACRNVDERVSTAKVLLRVLRKPQAISGLLQLNRRANVCAARLAAFVEQMLPGLRESVKAEGGQRRVSPEK